MQTVDDTFESNKADLELIFRSLADTLSRRQNRRELLSVANELAAGNSFDITKRRKDRLAGSYLSVFPYLLKDPASAFELIAAKRQTQLARQHLWSSMRFPLILVFLAIGTAIIFSWSFSAIAAFTEFPKSQIFSRRYEPPASTTLGALYLLLQAGSITMIASLVIYRVVGGHLSWIRILTVLPGIGGWIRCHSIADLFRTTALLLDRGLPLHQAMRLAATISENRANQYVARTIAASLEKGEPLSAALQRHSWFPIWVGHWFERVGPDVLLSRSFKTCATMLDQYALAIVRYAKRVIPIICFVAIALLIQSVYYERLSNSFIFFRMISSF